ncbi:MAG: hypothetical protein QOF60_1345, partial [Actinomycetota bacterium]|jgi:plastocyanin|nr:hypothetical protein [Actinomycetota bacterium]
MFAAEPEPDAEDGDDADDGDEGGKKRPRIRKSTVVVLVVAGWLLLTLFFVGQFSSSPGKPSQAKLDTAAGADDGSAADGEATADDSGSTDGGALEGVASATGDGTTSGGSGSATGGTAGGATPSAGGGSGTGDGSTGAIPGTGGTTGGGSGTGTGGATTTAKPGTATTTTAKPGGTTTTAKPGSTTTTTASPGTTATTAAPAPFTMQVTATNAQYGYPQGYGADFSFPAGSKVRFDNTESTNGIKHTFTISGGWDSGDMHADTAPKTSPALNTKGVFTYACTYHGLTMKGTITVT